MCSIYTELLSWSLRTPRFPIPISTPKAILPNAVLAGRYSLKITFSAPSLLTLPPLPQAAFSPGLFPDPVCHTAPHKLPWHDYGEIIEMKQVAKEELFNINTSPKTGKLLPNMVSHTQQKTHQLAHPVVWLSSGSDCA